MGMLLTINECCEEIRRLVQEEGYSINEAIDKVKKGYCPDQSSNNHEKLIDTIIAPGEDIDNGQVYSKETGETLRDLI